jgi:predicted Zn-ribbon and HTH transcriptional regulator
MSIGKPSSEEEEYFAREDAERRHALAKKKSAETAVEEQARLKALHFMKCPKCGFDLETVQFKGISIDKCFHCNGTWLDAGELETLAGGESHVWQGLASLFSRKK